MLEPLLGSVNAERCLLFILARAEGYASAIAKFFDTDLNGVQKQLEKLEQVAKNIKYYMNVVKVPTKARPMLVGQSGDVQRVFKGGVYEMLKSGNTYVEGTPLNLPDKVNALNFAWLPDKEAVELLVMLTPEERLRVFEPFVRLDPSRDRATGGCGLGLAIVHSIAVAYQGRVAVDSSTLGGASMRFSWPVKPTFNLVVEQPDVLGIHQGGGHRRWQGRRQG